MATTLSARSGVDDFLAIEDLGLETIEVPPWGRSITVRPATLGEIDRMQAAVNPKAPDKARLYATLLSLTAVEPEFSEEQAYQLFTTKSVRALKYLIDGLDNLNGFGDREKLQKADEDAFRE